MQNNKTAANHEATTITTSDLHDVARSYIFKRVIKFKGCLVSGLTCLLLCNVAIPELYVVVWGSCSETH